ncbi:helicase-associated domain-containing protein [Paenibacillus psychroresistens]|nr:helicase-associated domain-containing protein [Paenibacillus psychroresistens]
MKISLITEQIPQQLLELIIKNEPISSLLQDGVLLSEIMLSEKTYTSLYQAMKLWEKQTIKLIVCHFAARPFELSSLQEIAYGTGISGAEVTVGLAGLRKKGIIYAMRKHWGESSYALPTDMLPIWHNIVMESTPRWEETEDQDVLSVMEAPSLVLVNLMLFLKYIELNEVVLTKRREIPKRHINKIVQQLQWSDEFPCIWKPKPEYMVLYPLQMSLVIELADRLNLIYWGLSELGLSRSNLQQWLQLSKHEMTNRIYAIFQEVFVPNSAADEHFLAKLTALSFQKWYLHEDFSSWLQEYDIIMMFNNWMDVLEAFSWIEQGLDQQGRAIFRWMLNQENSFDEIVPQGRFYVQADYEILVPPDVSFAVRWELSYWADHIRTDQVGIYRLSEQSLQRALSNDRTLEQCLIFLKEHCFYDIPDSIQSALKQWARTVGQSLLLPRNQASLEPGNTVTVSTAFRGTIDSGIYELVVDIPSRDQVYPGWQTVPPLWWREGRAYHPSTQKEIAYQAIEWKATLKLSTANRTWTFNPKEVKDCEEGWVLYGWAQSDLISYTADQWQTIQLILPGFDDLIIN